jgi:hypothetical protein
LSKVLVVVLVVVSGRTITITNTITSIMRASTPPTGFDQS